MAFARDKDFARCCQQSEVASVALRAAKRPLTYSIINNPDALLAYRLQRMEIESPPLVGSHLADDTDDDITRIALQLQEQELLEQVEQELHDFELANRLAEEERAQNTRQNSVYRPGEDIWSVGHDNNHNGHNERALFGPQEGDGGVKRKGLTKQQISRIPFHKYKHQAGLNTCGICLSEYRNGEKITNLPCLHSFHKPCIVRWLKSQAVCPVCRLVVKLG